MPSAEIITIGTELLLGEIQDTNTRYLANKFKDINIDLFRITMIGDNANRIADLVKEAFSRSDIVITTGGLGPTVDDPTRDAIARAFNTHTEYHPELWNEIEERFLHRSQMPTENNKRQAYLPAGAEVINNPVGTAPAFFFASGEKIVICLPGVPREMEYLTDNSVIPLLREKFGLQGVIKLRIIHIAGMGESVVDTAIEEFEKLANPTVGLLAHPGIVDIRITAKANSEAEADRMIASIEKQIEGLFPNKIFGFDEDTLLGAVNQIARQKSASISIKSYGLDAVWSKLITANSDNAIKVIQQAELPEALQSEFSTKDASSIQVDSCFIVENNECKMEFNLCTNKYVNRYTYVYNGPTTQGPMWAANILLESIRQTLLRQ